METSLAESQTDSYFPTKWPNGYPKQKDVSDAHIQRRTLTKINHDRRTALEQSVKSISLRGLNRCYAATIPAPTSAILRQADKSKTDGRMTDQTPDIEASELGLHWLLRTVYTDCSGLSEYLW